MNERIRDISMLGLGSIASKIFGNANKRKLRAYHRRVEQINALEPEFEKLSDDELRAKTDAFKQRLKEGESLDKLLPEAFAAVREAAKRTLGQRHYDVQLIGGMVLHEGKIAEMKTGEGKTLVATLAAYLNALTERGVHVVTVNDYLAKRDAEWMGQVYRFLGLTVGVIVHGMEDDERREAYAADVTYATNNELGFDYLRDNMKYHLDEMVQRDHYFAIVDEVDSILIDEARTPLIISGPVEDRTELYQAVDRLIPQLSPEDYEIDEKTRSAMLTEQGNERMEELLREAGLLEEGTQLYDPENVTVVHHVNQALKAHKLFTRDKDYIVKDGEVVIIDEFTGRMMPGRRYSEGLHQALEAKEGVQIQPENQTLASITFQNYFRLYEKLAGMTGTAATEAEEFMDIYGLDVVEIPTNKPVQRVDENDEVYRTEREKLEAVIEQIEDCRSRKQPVLVGTTSIEKSERLSELLKQRGIEHQVLNARYHEQEAKIIAQAGQPGAVTIATNMAGRGTDIQLGGNAEMRIAEELADITDEAERERRAEEIRKEVEAAREEVLQAGGLYIIGTERHESRRIDNQLRGRSGRQGDPGRSKFYLSLDDDLMRIFGSQRMDSMLQKLGLQEGEAITHPWINKALEKAQQKVEAHNFDARKNLLKFDDVMNDQRKVIFEQRKSIMRGEEVRETVQDMMQETIERLVATHIPPGEYADKWDIDGLHEKVAELLGEELPVKEWAAEEGIADEEIRERLQQEFERRYAQKREKYGEEIMELVEKEVLLRSIDQLWREHLVKLEHLRQAVAFRGYGQRDPLQEYKTEAFVLFENMIEELQETVTSQLMRVELLSEEEMAQLPTADQLPDMQASHIDPFTGFDEMDDEVIEAAFGEGEAPVSAVRVPPEMRDPNDPSTWGKVGRNEPCPCGSGKKYKRCHGKLG